MTCKFWKFVKVYCMCFSCVYMFSSDVRIITWEKGRSGEEVKPEEIFPGKSGCTITSRFRKYYCEVGGVETEFNLHKKLHDMGYFITRENFDIVDSDIHVDKLNDDNRFNITNVADFDNIYGVNGEYYGKSFGEGREVCRKKNKGNELYMSGCSVILYDADDHSFYPLGYFLNEDGSYRDPVSFFCKCDTWKSYSDKGNKYLVDKFKGENPGINIVKVSTYIKQNVTSGSSSGSGSGGNSSSKKKCCKCCCCCCC